MKDLGKIVLHIPAREGSKRVPKKNMRDMNGNPMISYTIRAALGSKTTNQIYINTDAEEIMAYVRHEFPEVKIYEREKNLANDKASSDEFNLDIIEKLKPDTLIMINPVCPLITAEDIAKAVICFKKEPCDTLISASSTKMQSFCDGKPININVDEQLAPSQDNKLVFTLNWAITIWDAASFVLRMKEKNYAVLGHKRHLFEIDLLKGLKVSEEGDFITIEKILKANALEQHV